MYNGFHKNIKQQTNNNKKYFLSIQSAYYNDFWRIMWHWRLTVLNHNNLSQYYCFYFIFNQRTVTLFSIRLNKIHKQLQILPTLNF